MFTTRCFIRKNTPELRDKLEKLGYHICSCCKFKDNIWLLNFISDEHNRYEIHGLGAWDVEDNQEEVLNLFLIGNAEHPNPAIDCGDNEELFLAIAALRDDTDIYQWFVMDVEEYMEINQGDWFLATDRNKGKHIGTQIDPMCCHKATVKELIEHFKD